MTPFWQTMIPSGLWLTNNFTCCVIQLTDIRQKKKVAKNVLFNDTVNREHFRVWMICEWQNDNGTDKPLLLSVRWPQIPHTLSWDYNYASVLRQQQLTASANTHNVNSLSTSPKSTQTSHISTTKLTKMYNETMYMFIVPPHGSVLTFLAMGQLSKNTEFISGPRVTTWEIPLYQW